MEVGNAYSELTDPIEQLERFAEQRIIQQDSSNKDYQDHPLDLDFIHAVACGMPPTGGVGYGIDRMLMILLGQQSIRDVIPFPIRRARSC
jgi:lysyl-tRNA synthetase class 2